MAIPLEKVWFSLVPSHPSVWTAGHETRCDLRDQFGSGTCDFKVCPQCWCGIVWLASLIPSPQSMSCSVVPRPEKQSGNEFMYLSIGIPL